MKKLRCVVEMQIPDKSHFSESDMREALYQQFGTKLDLGRHGRRLDTRTIEWKRFSRVVQFQDGVRVKPPAAETINRFQSLVLRGLWIIMKAVVQKQRHIQDADAWIKELQNGQ